MDAAHPQYDSTFAYSWIKRGEERQDQSNTGWRRVNLGGAINLQTLEPIVRFDDAINAASMIALFVQIEHADSSRNKKQILYKRCYETFEKFKLACEAFFFRWDTIRCIRGAPSVRSRAIFNFAYDRHGSTYRPVP
jgi:hypothetical protein